MPAVSWLRFALVVTVAWPFLMAAAAMAGIPALTALVSLLPLVAAVGYAVVKLDPILAVQLLRDERVRQSWQGIRTVIVVELSLGAYFTFVPVHAKPFLIAQLALVLVILGLSQAGGALSQDHSVARGIALPVDHALVLLGVLRPRHAALPACDPAGLHGRDDGDAIPAGAGRCSRASAGRAGAARGHARRRPARIPVVLPKIHAALNDGNPKAAYDYVSDEILADAETLDRICKPLTYRAHYIEQIVERPGGLYDALVRVLFTPLDERAVVLRFVVPRGEFILASLADSRRSECMVGTYDADDRFGPLLGESQEVARRFAYAAMTNKRDVMASLVAPTLDLGPFLRSSTMATLVTETRVWSIDALMRPYDGLKAAARMHTGREGGVCGPQGTVYVEPVEGTPRIVAMEWDDTGCGPTDSVTVTDPALRARTLRRFGIALGEDERALAPVPRPATPAEVLPTGTTREDILAIDGMIGEAAQRGDRFFFADLLTDDFTWRDGEHVYAKTEFLANVSPQPDLVSKALRESTVTITATSARIEGFSSLTQGGEVKRVRYMNLLRREGGRWRLAEATIETRE